MRSTRFLLLPTGFRFRSYISGIALATGISVATLLAFSQVPGKPSETQSTDSTERYGGPIGDLIRKAEGGDVTGTKYTLCKVSRWSGCA